MNEPTAPHWPRATTMRGNASAARVRRWLWIGFWVVLAAPALYQLALLTGAIGGRFGYGYDLEWMEGGLLQHAQRIADRQGIYLAPSIDFIPYLYTPLYPGTIAVLGKIFGISYQLGRAISILSLLGIVWLTIASLVKWRPAHDATLLGVGPRWLGAALALGLFAAAYPYVEGWYDLVRGDTLFLLMITGGVHACARWARVGVGGNGDARMMAAGAILALSFFCKQTGVLYVGWGGVVLVACWLPVMRSVRGLLGMLRRAAVYTLTAAVIGLIGCLLLYRASNEWFWTYAFEIHQAHDFNMDRFYRSFGNILWHFPPATIVIALALVGVGVTYAVKRRLPDGAPQLFLWSATYAMSTIVGAVGWGTQFAHFNAYIPALLHGALAAGAAIPVLAGIAQMWADKHARARWITAGAVAAGALLVGVTLLQNTWKPRKYIPSDNDERAGAALVARIAAIEGDVWVPSHPWYAHLAGKRMFTHRMGIVDVTTGRAQQIRGLQDMLRRHLFAAIVVDPRDQVEVPLIGQNYKTDLALPGRERPRSFTGAPTRPEALLVPAIKEKPPFGAVVVFDFETGRYETGWDGPFVGAWGTRPVTGAVQGQGVVGGFGGRWYATSMNGGDKATGRLTSKPFVIEGSKITLRLGGGNSERLRVELRVAGQVVKTARASQPVNERLEEMTWDVGAWRGQTAHIVAVDDDTGSWGHISIDEIWLWP